MMDSSHQTPSLQGSHLLWWDRSHEEGRSDGGDDGFHHHQPFTQLRLFLTSGVRVWRCSGHLCWTDSHEKLGTTGSSQSSDGPDLLLAPAHCTVSSSALLKCCSFCSSLSSHMRVLLWSLASQDMFTLFLCVRIPITSNEERNIEFQ